MDPRSLTVLLACAFSLALRGQSYRDLTTTRERPNPYSSVFQIQGGLIGAIARDEDPAVGLEDAFGWDGHVYYRNESQPGAGNVLEAYAGRDGAFASLRDGQLIGDQTISRLELTARYFPWYREGFYRGSSFVPVGVYSGLDYGAYLGFGRKAAEDLYVEGGPFYKRNDFDREDQTAANYVIPEDYNAYGGRAYIEHNTLQIDRFSGAPRGGFLFSVVAEFEANDSDVPFGVIGGFQSDLPSNVWRGRGYMEWFFPGDETTTWSVVVSGALADRRDRVQNFDAQDPPGHLWADGQLRLRWDLADSFSVTPFAHAQYARVSNEDGIGSDDELFFGGGLEAALHFSESFSALAWYSFLDNEARPTVRIDEDRHGEHMFFIGGVVRFGATRR